MPQAQIDAANPVASSNAVTGPGGIPIGGTFEVLKASQEGQAGAGGGFAAFQSQTPALEKREAGRSTAPQRAPASKDTSPQGPMTVDQQVMQQHWQTMKDLGMQPIGDSINPLDELGPNASGFKGVTDATGVEHSLTGAVGPGGAHAVDTPRLRLQVPESHLRCLHLPQLKAVSLSHLPHPHHLLLPHAPQ
jgi:hypothetical protein